MKRKKHNIMRDFSTGIQYPIPLSSWDSLDGKAFEDPGTLIAPEGIGRLFGLCNGKLCMTKRERKKQKNGTSHISTNHMQLPFSTPWDGLDGAAPQRTLGNASLDVGTLSALAGKGLVCWWFGTRIADRGWDTGW